MQVITPAVVVNLTKILGIFNRNYYLYTDSPHLLNATFLVQQPHAPHRQVAC